MDFSRFDYGNLHEDQRARLGIGITDINGERWGYVQIAETMKFGQVVRSSVHTDLVSRDIGRVWEDIPAGSDGLMSEGGFQRSGVSQDLRGALGYIAEGKGAGQQFYIIENNDDMAKVFVLTGSTNRNQNKGWVTGLDATSKFLLFFPGQGRKSDHQGDLIEGVIQTDVSSDDIGKFCWVKRSGLTPCLARIDSGIILPGTTVIATEDGFVAGHGATGLPIGRGLASTEFLEDRALALVSLDIPDGPLSYTYPHTTNPFNEIVIR